jgi:acetolactate decarboxylase
MPKLQCEISQSLFDAIEARRRHSGESVGHIVMTALADVLQVDHATLFQVSTAGALVAGVYQGAVSVGTLLEHGDFGLGTFEDLDGEMVVLDGRCYRVRGDGTVTTPEPEDPVPFAVVTHFQPERTVELPPVASLAEFVGRLDELRDTQNMFFAMRADGAFDYVRTRAVCKADGHETLVETAGRQVEFELTDVCGTMVGFWTPEYAKTVNISGYHLHFLTDDRAHGGHMLDCRAGPLAVGIEHAHDFRMAIPETPDFLRADLSGDPTKDIDQAEH